MRGKSAILVINPVKFWLDDGTTTHPAANTNESDSIWIHSVEVKTVHLSLDQGCTDHLTKYYSCSHIVKIELLVFIRIRGSKV